MVKLCRAALILSAAFLFGVITLTIWIKSYQSHLYQRTFDYEASLSVIQKFDEIMASEDKLSPEFVSMKEELVVETNFQLDIFSSLGLKNRDSVILYNYLRDFFEVDWDVGRVSSGTEASDATTLMLLNENFDRDFPDLEIYLKALDLMIVERIEEKYAFLEKMKLALGILLLLLFLSLLTAIVSFELSHRQQKTPA